MDGYSATPRNGGFGALEEKRMSRRVVVTGLGTVNPLGKDTSTFWQRVQAGESGIGPVTRFDASDFSSRIAGEIIDFNDRHVLESRESRRMDLFSRYAIVAAMQALADAGLDADALDPERIGVLLGVGFGGMDTLELEFRHLFARGPKGVHPLLVPKMISNIAAGHIAIRIKAYGPSYTVVSACASANDAIGESYRWIKDGATDIMLSGGTEAPVSALALAGFCVLQAVSTKYNDDPARASRPFDGGRDGFVLGEGAGILVLEELQHARRRGAPIYAELAGYGATCDANHLTAPHPRGRGAVAAMRTALQTGGLQPHEVDYINAHGTSTQLNDATETAAIKQVFGSHAGSLKVSSTKSMVGHLLGAAGAVEAVATALAIRDQFFPPTINYEQPDPECDLDYVPNVGRPGTIDVALSNSFGFGGHNAVLAFRRYRERARAEA
jgi:3-oxoacyl-[acyl-carrier-protein] synthase II